MLKIYQTMRSLSFGKLMTVYDTSNREHGAQIAPEESEDRQMELSEQDFYFYLRDSFFKTPGARYAVWEVNGRYVSALRLEPYRDGLLLEGLETAPDQRGRGYATQLLQAVLAELEPPVPVYSHVDKKNAASHQVHCNAGFTVLSDSASFVDGSANHRSYTLVYRRESPCASES